MRIRVCMTILIACGLAACGKRGASDASTIAAVAQLSSGITAAGLTQDIEYLSSDALGGRAPGSKGEELALNYLVDHYRDLGFHPGNPDGTYIQSVPLVASTVTNTPTLRLRTPSGPLELAYRDDFMGWTLRQEPDVAIDNAELVFVGYGIVAPEYGWDDYKQADVAGKILVMLVGDPPLEDTSLFGGVAMTYYGRWTYKYEIAAEKGAAGAIIIHKTETAGYPWAVVSNSWSGEQFDIVRADKGADRCRVESWITQEAAHRLFEAAGIDLDKAYEMALARDFEPVPLGVTGSVEITKTSRSIRSHNVVARLPGHDPKHKDEFVIYTAHWDHLGVGNPVDGDSIYNGARDNASGVAATLAIARSLAENSELLKRSVLVINTTAEESGLLGAYQYTEHPLYPLTKTVAEINIDGLNIWGRTRDMVVIGLGFSDLDDYLQKAVAPQGRVLKPDSEPEKGYYYRSDHFPFAKKGVPALYTDNGVDFIGRPEGWGRAANDDYTTQRYHKPQDEIYDGWDLSGAVEDVEALFRVGLMIAATTVEPQWGDKSEFKEIRETALAGSR